MREIKFRAWFGHPHYNKPHMTHLNINDDFGGASATWQLRYLQHPEPDGPVYMQFTGLKDKNGVEIYEGDILRIGSSLIEEVKWVGVGDWVGAKQPMVGFISHETIYRKPIEVIGNIYENPELLELTNDQL